MTFHSLPAGRPQTDVSGLRILLVDDNLDSLSAFAELLKLEGMELTTASSGQQALGAISGGAVFDLLISDIGMPDMDGHALLARLRSEAAASELPAIALTGYNVNTNELGGARFDAYLCKPIMLDTLLDHIREIVNR